jgi:phospholipase C
MTESERRSYDRRTVLRAGLGAAAAAASPFGLSGLRRAGAASSLPTIRQPNTVAYPSLPAGQYTGAFPFDHIVMVMQENHSFDNYLGMLPVRGQPKADGFTFNKAEEPINWNPVGNERMTVFHENGFIGENETGSQSWNDTHLQINHGAMDGFARTGIGSMGYYDAPDLPFYYSLANTFCLANRWFAAVPSQTTPNRRFAQAGTAMGIINTDFPNTFTNKPNNGTIWDRLSKYNISWANYWSDAPTLGEMYESVLKYPEHLARIEQFYVDAALGTLPAVSMVDCNMGAVVGEITGPAGKVKLPFPIPTFSAALGDINETAESEEHPENVQLGEAFVARIVNAVMSGPAWHRTLLVWYYDEHGGYYDHVPPPRALAPDNILPELAPDNLPGDYTMYGVRLPVVVVSPYSRKHGVTNVVHDNTSVLSTIEQQWNLPAMTYRDANAANLMDFLDTSVMSFPEPPELAQPGNVIPGMLKGYQGVPNPPPPVA